MAIDWFFWKNMQYVKLWQAAYLACNVDPDRGSYDDIINSCNRNNFTRNHDIKALKVLRLLKANLCERQFFTPGILNLCDSNLHEVNLSEFAAWCIHIGYNIPPELSSLAKVATQAETLGLDEEGKEINAESTNNSQRNEIAKKWLDTKDAVEIESMTNKEILTALKLFSPDCMSLFVAGGDDWLSRDHSVIPKRKPGRKTSKRARIFRES